MKTSETISKIMPDLVKAQSSMGAATKEADNPFFKSKYADLSSVIKVLKDALNENKITYLQPVNGDMVETILIHESGEWVSDEGTRIICSKQNDPQAYGSAITYARRYGLMSFLGIPTEDDDGEKAMSRHKKVEPPKVSTQPKEPIEDTTAVCSVCSEPLRQAVLEYSMKHFNKPLCFDHQKGA